MSNLVTLAVVVLVGWLAWSWLTSGPPAPDNGRAIWRPPTAATTATPGFYTAGDAAWGGGPL